MTMEHILEIIKQKHGESALRDESRLMGFFTDYSHGQLRPQTNALRTFLDCKGNERVLNLQNASGLAQQTEYHRLIQEMVSQYNMQEDAAMEVCGAFWRVAIGTELPLLADRLVSDSRPFSEPKPPIPSKDDQESLTEVPPDSEAIPPKPLKAEPRMSWLERITFVLGCGVVCLILYGVAQVWRIGDTDEATMWSFMLFVALGIVIAMQYAVWKKKTRSWLSGWLSDQGGCLVWGILTLMHLVLAPTFSIMILTGDMPLDDFGIMVAGYVVFAWYHIFWNITAFAEVFRERKAQKRGGKK